MQGDKPDINETPDPGSQETDSLITTLVLSPESIYNAKYRHTDILIYSASGIQELLIHKRYDALPGKTDIRIPEGGVECIAIANCPYRLNTAALDRLDAAKQLCISFEDEDPDFPVMSGHCDMQAGMKDTIYIKPFLCEVQLAMASNAMDGYELAEAPRIWLTGLNPTVTILQEDGFRPTEFIAEGRHENLPSDIGFYTMFPDTRLYCYPNDTPLRELGAAHTAIGFEATIGGSICRAGYELPAFGRAKRIKVCVTVFGPDDIRFETLN